MTTRRASRRFADRAAGDDPLALVPNLFDVALVLAMAFLVAALSIAGKTNDDRASRMQEGLREAAKHLDQPTDEHKAAGQGVRLGSAYRLANGEIIYVPE